MTRQNGNLRIRNVGAYQNSLTHLIIPTAGSVANQPMEDVETIVLTADLHGQQMTQRSGNLLMLCADANHSDLSISKV